jgi:2-iminobutanoate/2-iminopropanoate deaminase
MMRTPITSDEAPAPAGPYSPGLVVGEWIYLSGQGGVDPRTGRLSGEDIAAQTAQTFANIETLLGVAGASLGDVVSCLVHLADLDDFAEFNAAYAVQFPGPARPVRTTVRADLLSGMRIEVTVVARREV